MIGGATNHPRRARRLVLAGLAVIAGGAAVAPGAAHAGTYTHVVCAHPDTRVGTGLTTTEGLTDAGSGTGWRATVSCPATVFGSSDGIALRRSTTSGANAAPGSWHALRYRVDQPGLRLERATLWRAVSSGASTTGEVRWGQHAAAALADPFAAPVHATERGSFTTNLVSRGVNNVTQLFASMNRVEPVTAGDAFAVSVACSSSATACSGSLSYTVFGMAVVIADDAAPQLIAASGPLAIDARIAGAPAARLELADEGAGLQRLKLAVDGENVRTVELAAGDARCRDVNSANADSREFAYQTPCPATRTVDVALPLHEHADGPHRLTITAEDASGNATAITDRVVDIDNHPSPASLADEPPAVLGDAAPGAVLTASSGAWLRASALAYRWERCVAGACAAIPGALGRTYEPVADDVGSDVRVVVTAANAIGELASASSRRVRVRDPSASPAASATGLTGAAAGDPEVDRTPPQGLDVARALTPALADMPVTAPASRPNGRHASPHARIEIRLDRRRRNLHGRLVTARGRPIIGARVELATSCLGTGHARCRAWVITSHDGTFAYRLPARPTRTISAAYRHDLTLTAAVARATVRPPRVRLRRGTQPLTLGRLTSLR